MVNTIQKAHNRWYMIGYVLLVLLAGCYGNIHIRDDTSARPETIDMESMTRGREIYQDQCLSCHGPEGKGNGVDSPDFDPPPPDLTQSGLHITTTGTESIIDYPHHSPEAMRRRIRHGKTEMPEFKNSFTEKEIRDIISYLRFLEYQGGAPRE